jgi:hypothetical protein
METHTGDQELSAVLSGELFRLGDSILRKLLCLSLKIQLQPALKKKILPKAFKVAITKKLVFEQFYKILKNLWGILKEYRSKKLIFIQTNLLKAYES